MRNLDHMPVACALGTAELGEREATLLAQFRSGVLATQEIQDGYAFRLSGDANSVRLVAELIVAERECCPFLAFELAAEPGKGSIILRVTGPAGTKEFLGTILVNTDNRA